jgi:choline kinase
MTHKCKQGVILAAGVGSRLGKHGEDMPKSLYQFNNKSLLRRNVDLMISRGIENIIVIGGYKIDMICDELKYYNNVIIVENKEYETTQTCYSMGLAYEFIEDCFIQTEGDLVFEEKAIDQLLKNSGNSMVHSEYRDTNSISVPHFDNGKLMYFERGVEYRTGNQQPPNFTGPSHFTKEMLALMINEDAQRKNSLFYEEAVALSIFNNKIPLSICYIPELRYWDLNKIEDYKNVERLINTLDGEAF